MTFTITYRRNGMMAGTPDRAATMYDARKAAQRARETRQFSSAVIAAPSSSGDRKEIEVIDFNY